MSTLRQNVTRVFAVWLLSATTFNLCAKEYYFRHYDRSNGLLHQTVYCAMQDSRGFMWFGTKAGLCRFDGQNFKSYTLGQSSADGLLSNVVNSIAEDNRGIIWVGTLEGLCSYNPEFDRFTTFQSDTCPVNGSVDNLTIDRQGNLWLTSIAGIFCINTTTLQARLFTAEEYSTPGGLCISQSGRVWVSCSDGYVRQMDPAKGEMICFKILTDEEINQHVRLFRMTEQEDGLLMIATSSEGARMLSPNTGKVQILFRKDGNGNPISIHTLLQTGPDEYWFGSESGIHVYKLGIGFTDRMYKSYDKDFSISDNAVHALTMDREGGIWAGTFFGGLNYLSRNNTLFEKYFPTDKDGHIAANVIRQIRPGPDGTLWIGTEDGGLCSLNPATNELSIRDDICFHGRRLPTNIQTLMPVGNDKLWIGTFDRGIYVLDFNTETIIEHFSSDDTETGLTTSMIVDLAQTSEGDILVGTQSGLFLFDEEERQFSPIESLNSSFVHSIFEDACHNIWVGTFGQGLYRASADSLNNNSTLEKIPFPVHSITTVTERDSDRLWIGSEGSGLFSYDINDRSVEQVISESSYPGLIIYQAVNDAMGNTWISSSYGLFQYRDELGIVNIFNKSNGIPIDQFNYNSSYQDHQGNIYFGSVLGLVSYAPRDMEHVTTPLKAYFTSLRLYDTEVEVYQKDSPLQKSLVYSDEITLNHDQHTFSIQFSAPTYSMSGNIWYRYRLEGVDNDWIVSYGPRRLSYTKLPPGRYVLCVQASEDYNSWEGEESRLTINVRPGAGGTLAARIMYVLLSVGILFLILTRIRKNIHTRENEKMHRLMDEQQKEVLEAKISFFTNITHEIRTPLTLIMGSLNRIKKKNEESFNNDENIQTMSRNVRRLYELVNQLLDFKKIESDYFQLHFCTVEMKQLLSETFSRFRPAAQDKDIDFTLDIEDGESTVTADREALVKILSNLLSNAVKFCSKHCSVTMKTIEDNGNEYIELRVNNDGTKIPDKEVEEIFKPFHQYKEGQKIPKVNGSGLGLTLARSLADMQNSRLFYDTSIRELNSFVLQIPVSVTESADREDTPSDEKPEEHTDEKRTGKTGRYTIMVVDDEADMRHFVGEELSDEYNVVEANDGKQALDLLDIHNISLIISDLMMPTVDGITLCRTVKNNVRYCHIPIIVLTAKVSMQAHVEALDSKADAYIEKPFSTDHLKAQIASLLANREIMRSTVINSPYAHLSSIASNSMDEKFIGKINDYVMCHLSDYNLSVENMAEYMNMSVSTLYRKVKSTTTLSPNDFIRLCKLKKSVELLSSGDFRVSEVADRLGFSKTSYFASCFMKQFGVSPNDFIKMNQRDRTSDTSDHLISSRQ